MNAAHGAKPADPAYSTVNPLVFMKNRMSVLRRYHVGIASVRLTVLWQGLTERTLDAWHISGAALAPLCRTIGKVGPRGQVHGGPRLRVCWQGCGQS